MKSALKRGKHAAGFTLVESMVAVLVLTILMAAVFSLINRSQTHFRVETQKVDFTQQQREFIDQFTRDMHQAGFPSANSLGPANAALAAQGLTFLSATVVTMDGDLDGTGKQTVTYAYNAGCSCLQRIVNGVASTAVENVVAPNPQEIFTGYDATGNPAGALTPLNAIKSIGVTLTVQGATDADHTTPIQITMTGMGRLPNN
jgi:prepilin-type N-terminal cleavage/methylation domain-containing protein